VSVWGYRLLAVLVGVLLALLISRRRASKRSPRAPRDEERTAKEDQRIAVHEAGHAVLTWSCATVSDFTEVSIDPRSADADADGFVIYKVLQVYDDTPHGQWCRTVMNLGGLAAEVMVYGKMRSGTSYTDLNGARRRAAWLVACGETTPPWKNLRDDAPTPPFAKMFEEPPTEEEVAVLAACWRMARAVLSAHRAGHGTLAESLVRERKLDSRGVALVLGRRLYFDHPVVHALRRLVLREWFYVPTLGAAGATETSETSSSRPS